MTFKIEMGHINYKTDRTLLGEFPEENAQYELGEGNLLAIELDPPEAGERKAIALVSPLFAREQRGTAGKERRIVYLGKQGAGEAQLSFNQVVSVTRIERK